MKTMQCTNNSASLECFDEEVVLVSANSLGNVEALILSEDLKVQPEVVFNINPQDSELDRLLILMNAVTVLINLGITIGQDPMQGVGSNDLPCWRWATVNVNDFSFPAPIHICKANDVTSLFTWSNEVILMSHEQCAYTTTIYYLNILFSLNYERDGLIDFISPVDRYAIYAALDELQAYGFSRLDDIYCLLLNQLEESSWKVLN